MRFCVNQRDGKSSHLQTGRKAIAETAHSNKTGNSESGETQARETADMLLEAPGPRGDDPVGTMEGTASCPPSHGKHLAVMAGEVTAFSERFGPSVLLQTRKPESGQLPKKPNLHKASIHEHRP